LFTFDANHDFTGSGGKRPIQDETGSGTRTNDIDAGNAENP